MTQQSKPLTDIYYTTRVPRDAFLEELRRAA